MRSRVGVLLIPLVLLGACASANPSPSTSGTVPLDPVTVLVGESRDFGEPPPAPGGALTPDTTAALETVFGPTLDQGLFLAEQYDAIGELGRSGDPRVGWLLADLLRFAADPTLSAALADAAAELLDVDVAGPGAWGQVTDHLIAWDVPAPPDYLRHKRRLFVLIVPEWERLFADDADVDWRHVSWGGVGIDDRPFGETDAPCRCIPAADDPDVTGAADAGWLTDDAVVFGVEINGEARAYPRRIMEVREMVNDTVGGRDIGMPYCTLCGSAQVYFTDEAPPGLDRPVLRTSGLLIRSNKVMFDVNTFSLFDTFTGEAVSGPFAERGVVLGQSAVVTTTWGEWRADHPETTVLVEELALGRDPDFRNGRDADGPIFPIGDADPRLAVHEDVLGVVTASGRPVAFHVAAAIAALRSGRTVDFENVRLELDGGGVRAVDADGTALGSHQAFWFAWSQFHPDTELWTGPDPASP